MRRNVNRGRTTSVRTILSLALFFCFALPLSATVTLQRIAGGFDTPVDFADPNDGTTTRFIAQQNGVIRSMQDGVVDPLPFADLRGVVRCCDNSNGLMSIALHPRFTSNGIFFVQYTDADQNTAVARFVAPDRRHVDLTSRRVLLVAQQPADDRPNHQGGKLNFGPDGYLYITIGDGGTYFYISNNSQRLDTFLGKALRIDVDSGDPYSIPPSNPFVSRVGARPEIWATGLRNPWRSSFDRVTGDYLIGDVGERTLEEVDRQPRASAGGENYGWPAYEATQCFLGSCSVITQTAPVVEYSHDGGNCSITGGYVYRGTRLPELYGSYIYGDFCSGTVWAATPRPDGSWTSHELLQSGTMLVSFGEDHTGEVVILDWKSGTVFALVEVPSHRRASAK